MRISAPLYILEQFFCGISTLVALGRAAHLPRPMPLRLLTAALFGALAAFLQELHPSWLLHLGMLALVLMSPRAVWSTLPRRMYRRLSFTLLMLLMLFSGCMRAAYFPFLPRLPSLLICCLLLPLLSRTPHSPSPACTTLEIRHGASRVVLTALVDTGNLLRDPLSTLPVVVISRRAAQRLIDPPEPGRLNPGLRQIAIRTIAGTSSMTVFRPASLRLLESGTWQEMQAIVGIAPDGYSGVQALVPASLLHSSTLTQGG